MCVRVNVNERVRDVRVRVSACIRVGVRVSSVGARGYVRPFMLMCRCAGVLARACMSVYGCTSMPISV